MGRAKAGYLITGRQRGKNVSAQVGLRGEAIIDRDTHAVLHLTYGVDGVPSDFPICESNVTVDYGEAEIAGSRYLLPLKATVVLRQSGGDSRNQVSFHDYRKFSADSSVMFDTGAGGQKP